MPLDVEDGRPVFDHAAPAVEETHELVAEHGLALAHDGADHGVEARAIATPGQDSYSHAPTPCDRAVVMEPPPTGGIPTLQPLTTAPCEPSVVLRVSLGIGRFGEETHLPLEIADVSEAFIHAGKPDVSHLVDGPEVIEHGQPDLVTGHVRTLEAQGFFHLDGQGGHLLDGDRSVLGGRSNPRHHLGPVERLPLP
jgi:hypothetical protein